MHFVCNNKMWNMQSFTSNCFSEKRFEERPLRWNKKNSHQNCPGILTFTLWFVKVSVESKKIAGSFDTKWKVFNPLWKEKIAERAKKEELEREQQRSLSRRSFKSSSTSHSGPPVATISTDESSDMVRDISQCRVTPGIRGEAHALKYQPRQSREVRTGKFEAELKTFTTGLHFKTFILCGFYFIYFMDIWS